MLELEVVPERSIGCEQWEFVLGMHFSQAVSIIQNQVGIIKGVQVLYCDSNPLGADLVLNLPQDGIRLIFDPVVQRLKIIEVYNMKLVKLKYCGLIFNSPEVCPSIEQIEHSFGATHPGVYDAEKQLFVLNFRGLSFSFPVESKFQPGYSQGLGSLQFASGSSPCVSCTNIYSGHSLPDCSAPPLPLSCYYAQMYLNYVDVLRDNDRTKGLRLHMYTEGTTRSRKQSLVREIHFTDTCQDVCTLLGAPQKVFFKAEDKMKIHSPNAHRRVTARRSDFSSTISPWAWLETYGKEIREAEDGHCPSLVLKPLREKDRQYTSFRYQWDVLFDAKTEKVKKFVLHTNYPGHYNFNIYHRCEFHLNFPSERLKSVDSSAKTIEKKSMQISAYTKWDTISEQLKPSDRPVVLNRASSTNTTNPFGSTFCYGYQDIIFEVMSNQHIASVTLYYCHEGCGDV